MYSDERFAKFNAHQSVPFMMANSDPLSSMNLSWHLSLFLSLPQLHMEYVSGGCISNLLRNPFCGPLHGEVRHDIELVYMY